MKNNSFFFYILFIVLIVQSCAQPATPTGGEKDTKPPIIIESTIPNKAINTAPKLITFYFDENVKITNPEKNVFISPMPSVSPKFTKTNKSLTIDFRQVPLNKNTTYTIQFNEAIADLNENNIGSYKTFYFSTGATIDSLNLNILVKKISTSKKDNYKIICTNSNNPIDTFTGLYQKNSFHISGLNSDPKTILIYNDANNNNIADDNEEIGYKNLSATTQDSISIYTYNRSKHIVETKIMNGQYYLIGLNTTYAQYVAKSLNIHHIKDTLFSNKKVIDNIKSMLSKEYYIISDLEESKNPYLSQVVQQSGDSISHTYSLTYNQNIQTIIYDSIRCYSTTNSLISNSNISITISDSNTLNIRTPIEVSRINIPTNSIRFYNTLRNKNTELKPESLCTFVFNNPGEYALRGEISYNNNKYIVSIEPKTNAIMRVPCGTYSGIFYEDKNNNYELNAPVPQEGIVGEQLLILEKMLTNPNLESNIVLKMPE